MLPQLLAPRPYFANLPDPRRETGNKLHELHDILTIVLCAVSSGVEDWMGMADFAEEKEAWLRGFLELPRGIPSHDTLSEVLGRIDPVAFRAAFTAWATAALPSLADEPMGMDGKAVRGSRDGTNSAVPLVGVFAGRARRVLAQPAVAEKSNEITAIPDLLGLLDLRGAVVSIDAMGCRKAIAQTPVDAGADYVLALEDNPPTSCADVPLRLDTEVAGGRRAVLETVEKDHGRIEIRRHAPSSQMDGPRPSRTGPGSRRSAGSSPPELSGRKPAPNPATSCARWRSGSGLRPRRAMGYRKSTALGLGRAIRGRCLPDPQGPLGGKPGP